MIRMFNIKSIRIEKHIQKISNNEFIEYEKNIVNINGLIIVDRESLKKIIIGKQGTMIKEIGTLARNDIELLLGKKVYLELYVKVLPKWRDKDRYLQQLGFTEFNN